MRYGATLFHIPSDAKVIIIGKLRVANAAANQGEMKFGAENRLFVILVDTVNMSQSWKMKRAFSLIEPKINNYLDQFNEKSLKEIDFVFKKNNHKALADAIFIVK